MLLVVPPLLSLPLVLASSWALACLLTFLRMLLCPCAGAGKSPYDDNNGPVIMVAKLSKLNDVGEGISQPPIAPQVIGGCRPQQPQLRGAVLLSCPAWVGMTGALKCRAALGRPPHCHTTPDAVFGTTM